MIPWLTQRIPRPYIRARYDGGETIVDTNHVILVDWEDVASIPVLVSIDIVWLTPRQYHQLEECDSPF